MQKIKNFFFDEKGKQVYIKREWQIIVTLLFVCLLVLAWIDGATFQYSYNRSDLVNAALGNVSSSSIRHYSFTCAINDYFSPIVIVFEYIIFLSAMFFLWKDKPKNAFSCTLFMLLFVVLFFTEYSDPVDGYITENEIWFLGYLYIAVTVVLIVVSFLMTKKTVEGNRPLKQVAVIENVKPISASDELLKLKELLDKNIISEEEFEEKKKEYISKL